MHIWSQLSLTGGCYIVEALNRNPIRDSAALTNTRFGVIAERCVLVTTSCPEATLSSWLNPRAPHCPEKKKERLTHMIFPLIL